MFYWSFRHCRCQHVAHPVFRLCGPPRQQFYEFYEQLVRVKDFAIQPFADNAQQLLVKYICENLGQPQAAKWYEEHWTGPFGRYSLAYAGYTWCNNNMSTEVDWRDMKGGRPPSATLGTFTRTLVCLIGQIGTEHCVLLSKHETAHCSISISKYNMWTSPKKMSSAQG